MPNASLPDPLLERLQRAVAPDYRVERELAGGGMGRVYLAHEILLNRSVAIKVLRPELATAGGAESFLREAQMLASVRHPNVIVIYRPGEGQGLQFYVMELVNGPTLEDRLSAGPIPARDVVRIGTNLLDGLETVHRLGLVHRDVKPSNVFLLPNRALLGDFGIARPPSDEDSGREGTPEYMAPEQVEGKPITPLTDVYSTGVVLYEAVSGRRFHEQGERVDWIGVPQELGRVLRRAVATTPMDRWPDAASFRAALERSAAPQIPRRIAPVAAGVLVLGVLGFVIVRVWSPAPPATPGAPKVTFERIEYLGPSAQSRIADSLLGMVHDDLRSHVNFADPTPPSLAIQARMTLTSGAVALRLTGGIPASEFRVPLEHWPTLRDSVTYQILLGIWADRSPLASSLPVRALPRTPEGLVRFLEAERLVAEARWDDAHRAYLQAEATDSTCWICSWRITEIERWLSRRPDPDRVRRYRVHADSLPPLYRSIVHAAQVPLEPRLDTLRAAANGAREVFLGWFQLGDELFHRGPLAGHRRAEAIPPLERAARLRPDFGPAWEHLAWVATAEGDSAGAAAALDSLNAHGATADAFSAGLRALLQVGFAWRFLPESVALSVTQQVTSAPATQSSAELGAGPRLLPAFDVPRGAFALGGILQTMPSRDLKRSGLIGQMLSAVALGEMNEAWERAGALKDVAPETELELFVAELRGALALLDPGSVAVADALEDLRPWRERYDRAAWMTLLLGGRGRASLGPHAPDALRVLLSADSLAGAGRPRAALATLDGLDVDAAAQRVDPFFRAIVHLRRAEWYARIRAIADAKGQLRWHEHTAVIGLPTGLPQAAEVDWAFGTVARWRLARLLDAAGRPEQGEACAAYAAVIRHWTGAPSPFGVRADSARMRTRALGCGLPSARPR